MEESIKMFPSLLVTVVENKKWKNYPAISSLTDVIPNSLIHMYPLISLLITLNVVLHYFSKKFYNVKGQWTIQLYETAYKAKVPVYIPLFSYFVSLPKGGHKE